MNVASDVTVLWWISIGIGVTVVLCVVVLLSLVTSFVNDIDRHVDSVLLAITHVSTNTVTSVDLLEAARLIGEMGTELETQVARLEAQEGYL